MALFFSVSIANAQNVAVTKVMQGTNVTPLESAQFLTTDILSAEFDSNGKLIMKVGSNIVAELPMKHDAVMNVNFGTYDADANKLQTTVSTAGYSTMYSAFQTTVPETDGLEVYAPIYDNGVLRMNPSTKVAAGTVLAPGTGIILKAPAGSYNFTYASTTASNVESALDGTSVVTPVTDFAGKTIYSLAKENGVVAFYHYTGDNTVAGKAFLTTDHSSAKAVQFIFDDEATNISSLNQEKKTSLNGKFIENGRIVIVKGYKKYNTAGQTIK